MFSGFNREDLVGTIGQVVAIREDQPVPFRQLLAGEADGIDAHRFTGLLIIDNVAVLVLPIRTDLQQNRRLEISEEDLGIIQTLTDIFNIFGINTGAGVGVVFDFDGQVTTDTFDKDGIGNIDVRMLTHGRGLHAWFAPFKIMGRREDVIALATVIDVGDVARKAPSAEP